jgi:hypothetical protein
MAEVPGGVLRLDETEASALVVEEEEDAAL